MTNTEIHPSGLGHALPDRARGHWERQLDLCRRLENLADCLPDNVDKRECLAISQQLYPIVRDAHKFEETALFPFLVRETGAAPDVVRSIGRLRFEHWEDESAAEDIGVTLRQMVSDPEAANADAISYMLRGFFDGLRRHIAFEIEHLLPLLTSHIHDHHTHR